MILPSNLIKLIFLKTYSIAIGFWKLPFIKAVLFRVQSHSRFLGNVKGEELCGTKNQNE